MRSRVFPAYAGVNLADGVRLLVGLGIPRVCGGEPWIVKSGGILVPYSPRMRG